MSTASACLTVRGIRVDVLYKDIKNLHIGVYPPLGRVRVAAPKRLDDEHVRLAVIQRLPWIKRQRQQLQDAARQSQREMITGESHYVWGVRYRLKIVERPGRRQVKLEGDRLIMCVPAGTDTDARRRLLDEWYRDQLRARIPGLIERWEPKVGRQVAHWQIKRMKTKWGSCSPDAARLWFNVELAKKHPLYLEYIVVHEMTHLLERNHGEHFTALMDRFLPRWRAPSATSSTTLRSRTRNGARQKPHEHPARPAPVVGKRTVAKPPARQGSARARGAGKASRG